MCHPKFQKKTNKVLCKRDYSDIKDEDDIELVKKTLNDIIVALRKSVRFNPIAH